MLYALKKEWNYKIIIHWMNEFESAYDSLDKTAFSLSRLDYNFWIY